MAPWRSRQCVHRVLTAMRGSAIPQGASAFCSTCGPGSMRRSDPQCQSRGLNDISASFTGLRRKDGVTTVIRSSPLNTTVMPGLTARKLWYRYLRNPCLGRRIPSRSVCEAIYDYRTVRPHRYDSQSSNTCSPRSGWARQWVVLFRIIASQSSMAKTKTTICRRKFWHWVLRLFDKWHRLRNQTSQSRRPGAPIKDHSVNLKL